MTITDDVPLEPCGMDVDGQVKPIAELSYWKGVRVAASITSFDELDPTPHIVEGEPCR